MDLARFGRMTDDEKASRVRGYEHLTHRPQEVVEARNIAESFDLRNQILGTSNAKLEKGSGLPIAGLNMLPNRSLCPAAGNCMAVCLGMTAGRNVMRNVRQGKRNRTKFFEANSTALYVLVAWELSRLLRKYGKIACRLNVTSDVDHEAKAPWVFEAFSEGVTFYDYTKRTVRAFGQRRDGWPKYSLTLSKSENLSDEVAAYALAHGVNVAVVFHTEDGSLPTTWQGFPVIDGDLSDRRYEDPSGVVVGLRAKGAAKKDTSGFVVRV